MAKASPGRELFGFTTKSLQGRPTWTFPAREKQIEYSNKKCIQTARLLQSHCNWLLQLNAYCNDLLWHTFSSNRCCVLTESVKSAALTSWYVTCLKSHTANYLLNQYVLHTAHSMNKYVCQTQKEYPTVSKQNNNCTFVSGWLEGETASELTLHAWPPISGSPAKPAHYSCCGF